MSAETGRVLLVDANVLIDYVKTDVAVLGLAASHLGQVCVLSTVVAETDGLSEAQCRQLGMQVHSPSLLQVMAAGGERGSLSLEDRLCLAVAEEQGWTCLTNDGALRRACARSRVPVMWGLELMVELVQAGRLSAAEAVIVAEAIHRSNPLHITAAIVAQFAAKVAG